ncbi:hypothetical protein HDU84_005862 [Entophlyctis sp. JEL0112]|nr:hypothetical protein HDU84_005862 [Entophlyctis sp. JEL0112]
MHMNSKGAVDGGFKESGAAADVDVGVDRASCDHPDRAFASLPAPPSSSISPLPNLQSFNPPIRMDRFCADSPEGQGPWSPVRNLDFSPCFEYTASSVLNALFAVCAVFAIFTIYCLRPTSSSITALINTPDPISRRARAKVLLSVFLALAIATTRFLLPQTPLALTLSAQTSAVVTVIALTIASSLHWLHDCAPDTRTGSSILLFFWLFSILCSAIQLRTDVLIEALSYSPNTVSHALQLVISIVLFVLENLPYPRPQYSLLVNSDVDVDSETYTEYEREENDLPEPPEAYANIFSRLTFHWMDPLMKLGYKKDLDMDDLWSLRPVDSAKCNSTLFLKMWDKQLGKKQSYGLVFGSAAILKACQDVLSFIQPTFLRYIMEFTNSWLPENKGHEQPLSRGFGIAVLMLLAAATQTFLLHQYFQICVITGMRVKAAVVTAVYQKALRLSPAARQSSTVGEIVNLMSVDAGRIADLTTYFHIVWSGPFQISLALYFLYFTLGPSVFAGVAVMLLMSPINGFLATKSRRLNKVQMGNKDARTKLMDELLNGIKVIKLYAWERVFRSRVHAVRDRELKTLVKIGYLSATSSFTWVCTPLMVSFLSFAVYSFASDEPLTSTKVFVSMSLFNLLQFPLTMFPSVITAIIDASVSFNRLFAFLLAEELDPHAVLHERTAGAFASSTPIERIVVENGSFGWTKLPVAAPAAAAESDPVAGEGLDEADPGAAATGNTSTLSNINLRVAEGKLVAIVGAVGSGKSSLLSALLGEMYVHGDGGAVPAVTVRGTIAYVPQTPWIVNATLRENIVFGSAYEERRYREVVEACGLEPDLRVLPSGDLCEIGERGINLSGGQKQRIALARAVYAMADVYLLDDTLSAVDAHVGRHIFDKVIGPRGLLREKARILVTHSIHVVPDSDFIVLMQGGEIVESGTYKVLMNDGKKFASLMKEYGKRKEESVGSLNDIPGSVFTPNLEVGSKLEATTSAQKSAGCVPNAALTVKEESAKGSVSWSVYAAYASSCGVTYICMFLANAVLSQFLSISQNLYLADWADSNDRKRDLVLRGLALPQDVEPENVMHRLMVYGGIGFLYASSFVFQTIFVWVFCGVRSARELHQQMLENVLRLPQSYFDTTPLGRILNRFSKDVYTVDEVLPRVFQGYARTLFTVLAVLVINTIGNWMFILFVIPLGMLYIYFQRYYLSTSRELKRLDSTSRSPIFAHFQETLMGVSTIRAYAQSARFVATNEQRVDYNMRAYYPSVSSNRWLAVRLEFIGTLIVFGSAMFAVASIAINGRVSASLVGLALTYSLSVTQSLNWLIRQSCEIETNIVSVERMKEYIDIPQEAPYTPDDAAHGQVVQRVPPFWPDRGVVEFRDYETRYRKDLDPVLKKLSFVVGSGEKLGIVGRTGAGSIMEASAGAIYIDGVDISKIGLYDLRSNISIIPQDAFIFNGTVRENLDPFGKSTDSDLWEALDSANMKSVVAEMSGGLDAVMLQNGENLSCGQRQLLCLARAVIRKSKVLILDEATAAIDYETDNVIQKTIRQLAQQATVITIAHRINTIIDYDRILVLDQGRLAELDSPQNLMKNRRSMFFGLAKEAGLTK